MYACMYIFIMAYFLLIQLKMDLIGLGKRVFFFQYEKFEILPFRLLFVLKKNYDFRL